MVQTEKAVLSNTMYLKNDMRSLEAKMPSSNSVGKPQEKDSHASMVKLTNHKTNDSHVNTAVMTP